LCLNAAHPLTAQQRTAVLISEAPENLVLFDRYQQQMSYNEIRSKFYAYAPFFIEERRTLLSDNLTNAMKTRFNNQLFFIGLDEDGNILQRAGSNFEIYSGCEAISDTAVVLRDNAIWIQPGLKPQQTDENQRFFLSAGDNVIRLFKWKQHIYVQTTGGIPIFGWSNLTDANKGQLWEPPRNAESRTPGATANNLTFDEIENFVQEKLGETNKVMANLFAYFNRQYQRDLPPPKWVIRSTPPREIICELTDAPADNRFSESTRYLFIRIENYLLKSAYTVKLEGNRIIIHRKNA
jgi:hypothetical protein